MPQRVPISPQWRMNFCATGERASMVFCNFSQYRNYTNSCDLSGLFGAAHHPLPRRLHCCERPQRNRWSKASNAKCKSVAKANAAAGHAERLVCGGEGGDDLGHLDADQSSLPFVAGNLHLEIGAVEDAQAFMDVADADPVRVHLWQAGFGDADTVVLHFDH